MAAQDAFAEIDTLIRARYPIVYVVSFEEKRVEDGLRAVAASRGKKFFTWSITEGFLPKPSSPISDKSAIAALETVRVSSDNAVFVLKDFHVFMSDSVVVRRLRDIARDLKNSYKTLIILSPVLRLPPEVEKEIAVVDIGLPSLEDLGKLLDDVMRSVSDNNQIDRKISPQDREMVLKAAQGLTLAEAENVFARSFVEKRALDVETVLSEKEQVIRKSGVLDYYPSSESFSDVGGLDTLKDWLGKRRAAFTEKAREFGLPEPKGILIIGVQGCGKSLTCKAVGSLWRLPLLRLDVGKIFSGIVGSSEENVRRAIRVAESVAPVILWMDEMEKGFAGVKSSPFSDAGTTSRVFGTFVTWLQEKSAAVFVVATANDISQLPPELMRKGRFDEIFFVDLPREDERKEIFSIHLRKRHRDPEEFDLDLLAKSSKGYSGAEIEQAIVAALFDAFDAGREVTTEDIVKAIKVSVPLSVTMEEEIDNLREWARTRARQASGEPRVESGESRVERRPSPDPLLDKEGE